MSGPKRREIGHGKLRAAGLVQRCLILKISRIPSGLYQR